MQSSLPITTFFDLEGNPLNNGYLLLQLSKDTSISNKQLCSKSYVKILLDSNGVIIGNPQLYTNSSLNPNDSYYILKVFSNFGQQVGKTQKVIV